MKKLLLFLISTVIPIVAWCAVGDTFTAQTIEGVTMTFQITSVTDKTCRAGVTNNVSDDGWSGRSAVLTSTTGTVTIPNKVNGYYVTEINRQAFAMCSKITSITIPEGVTSIGEDAFMDCTKLSSITLPQTVITIGNGAFVDCNSLESISLPNGLESLGELAFGGCNSLLSITLPNNITTIENNTFDGCKALSNVTFPSGLRTIGNYAFSECKALSSVTIPRLVTSIGKWAFSDCENLTSITLPYYASSLTFGNNVFDNCGKLSRITIDDYYSGLKAIIDIIESCPIKYVNINHGTIGYDIQELNRLTYLEELYLGTNLEHGIPDETFYNHQHLKRVDLKPSVEIGNYAFQNCSNLESFNAAVSSLGDYCFMGTKITSLIISAEKCNWADDDDAYYNQPYGTEFHHMGVCPCYGVKNYVYTDRYSDNNYDYTMVYSNYRVQNGDLYSYNGKTLYSASSKSGSFNLPSYTNTIADYAISGLDVTDVNLGNVENIGEGLLYGCQYIKTISVNSSNTAFTTVDDVLYTKDMTELVKYPIAKDAEEMTIPASVTKIWDHAFQVSGYGTESLRIINVEATVPPAISYFTTDLYNSEITVRVPYGCKAAYEAVEGWRAFKGIVEMPAPVVNITFADANVKTLCVANWDDNDDGELSEDEAAAVTSLGEVFRGNTEITSFDELQYFTGLTTIDGNAFDLCSQLASVVLPPNITTIGGEAFKGTALTSVVVPEGVTEIVDRGFADCASMTSVTLPSTLTTLRQGAFINCPNLESINLPKSVTTIELAAFRGCSSLNSIDLSGMTVTIAEEAFLGTGLEELTIPATVTLTGWTNLGWCSNLKMVTVECEGELPSDIFKACAQLETVVLPNASAMRWGSFVDCPKLESVTFLSGNAGDVPYFRNFTGTPDDVMFNVPAGTAESFLKMGYWNLSDLSALPTVKGEFEAEAVAIETMADGISDGDKTTLANAINEARTAVTNADSYASVIEQIDAIKTAAKTYIAGATLEDNTDITAATVINADFNNFTIGWKHGWSQFGIYSTGSLINDDVVLDKFIEAWDPTEGNLFSQTIKSLPAGIYRLEADIVTNPWEPAEVEGVNFFAGNRQKEVVTEANLPQHFSVQFSNNLVGDCMVGIRIADTHSVIYVAMDNVRLYYVCKTADVPQGVDLVSDADARVYLYNVETGKYLNAGHSYGTHAILDETGLPVRLTKNDETNLWQIYFWEGSRYQQLLFDEGENVWVDYNGQGDKSPWWSITQTGDGSYLIQGEAKADTENYLGNNPSRQDMQASYTGVTYTDIISTATVADNIHWRIFTKDDVDLIAAKKSLIATIIRMGESDNVNDDLIASAMSVYEDANASLAAIINAIALLNSQMGMPTEGNSIDMTVLITNPRFENNTTEGWAGANVADGSATPTNYHVHEYFQTNFNMYQTILGVPNGRYLLKWKGFHRPGAKETVAADYAADTDNASAVVYANEVQKTMHNIASDQSDTRLHGTDYETADGFFPDVMEGTRLYFDANHYADQLEVEVTDNVLTIGVKNTENMGERHWVIFSDFELYILENAEQMGNKLAITGGRGVKGGTGKMTVSMANEDEISGIQFRVKLPDGVNFSLTNGKPRITATSRVSGLTVEASKVDDYAQVLIYGMGKSASGNSGDILSLALEVSEELNADEYELELSNIFLTKSDGLVIKQGSVNGTLTIVEPASGDANRDGDVNVGDIIAIANYILGSPSANFDEEAADFNGDGGKPNVGDIIAIANYILGNNSKARKRVNMELDPQ